jgi:serine/threonine-protein kinase HipA
MALPTLSLQMRHLDQWRRVATVTLLGDEEQGELAATKLEYDLDYALEEMEGAPSSALSLLFPVTLESRVLETWPSFLLDLFPQGHALKFVEKYYKIPDQRKNYWRILATCQLYPPGNLKIEVSTENPSLIDSNKRTNGFSRDEVVTKGENFLEHMLAAGAPVAGTTGASGAAPKFLLREDSNSRFHADSALEDAATKNIWLVKFPRGKTQNDFDILQTEARVHRAAGRCGLFTHGKCLWFENALFIERFDRRISDSGQVECLGLESFYSALGSVTFGEFRTHEEYLNVIAHYSSEPEIDIAEYLARDLLSRMISNTDNHGRNSSFLKDTTSVRLAPLYDMAPMAWDAEGIVRSTRWRCTDGNWVSFIDSLVNQHSLDSEVLLSSFDKKCKGLLNFWDQLEEQNGVEFFLTRGVRAQDMIALVKEEQKRGMALARRK